MINKFEVSRKAKEFGLQSSTIEKDYVLGWMLIGIQNHPDLTITFIESLSLSYLKAELLLGAASALSTGRQLPLSSRPQQRVEKPDQ